MLQIRPATHADTDCLKEMYLSEVEGHTERATAFAEQLTTRFKTLLALHDGHLCGTVTWDTRGGYDDGVVELVGLGVNSAYQRRGIATRLVDKMITDASQFYSERGYTLRAIILFMERKNEGARKFYSRVGFSEVAKVPSLYPRDDAVIWTRHL
jgi:ribosomal protein S18 acetylase RimI-like enzyme